jgi:hypothetical protein
VGIVLAAVAVVVIVMATRDSGGPAQVESPAPQSDPELDQLAAYLPPEVSNCVEGSGVAPSGLSAQAIAIMLCDGPVAEQAGVLFYLFDSPDSAAAAYQTYLQERAVAPDSGDCLSGVSGDESWSGAGGSGRIFCGVAEGNLSAMIWTSDGFPVLGHLTSRDPSIMVSGAYEIWQGISDYQ